MQQGVAEITPSNQTCAHPQEECSVMLNPTSTDAENQEVPRFKLSLECARYLQGLCLPQGREDVAICSIMDSDIIVELDGEELWNKFSEKGTEMVVTRAGRRLYPQLRLKLRGLNPNVNYYLIMDMHNIDKHRYKYQNREWVACATEDLPYLQSYYVHPLSPSTGSKWMERVVSFQKAKITSSYTRLGDDMIHIYSMHRYQPRVHVVRSSDLNKAVQSAVSTFSFKVSSFMAVTAYQNIEITKLKVEHNPFAKGFRTTGGRRKRSLSPDFETSEELWERPQSSMAMEVWDQENRIPHHRSIPFWEEQHHLRSSVSAPLPFPSPQQPHSSDNYSRLNRFHSADHNRYSTLHDFDSSNNSSSSDSHGMPETGAMNLNTFLRSSIMNSPHAIYCSSCKRSVRDCMCSASSSSRQCPNGCCSRNQFACPHALPSEAEPRNESMVSNIVRQTEYSYVARTSHQEYSLGRPTGFELLYHSSNNQ